MELNIHSKYFLISYWLKTSVYSLQKDSFDQIWKMFAIYGKMTSTRSAEYNDREKAYHPRKPVDKVAFKVSV